MRGSSLNTADNGRLRPTAKRPVAQQVRKLFPVSDLGNTDQRVRLGRLVQEQQRPAQVPISASVVRASPDGRTREFAAARPVERSGKELEYV